MDRKQTISLTIMLLTLASSSCQMLHTAKLATIPSATVEHPVAEIICVWQPGEGTGLDGLPTRGFAGQLIFFAMGMQTPVRVDGKVRIYVFDDQGTEEEQERPIHQFDFDSQAFQSFLTTTNMGAAYQLFLPYTRKGGQSAACTLRVRFTPDEGSTVYSKMATIVLPGSNSRKQDQPIEQADQAPASRNRTISEILLTGGHEEAPSATNQMTLAEEIREATRDSANMENKRRLRSTLNEISAIPSASQPTAIPAEAPVSRAESVPSPTPGTLKLHPINSSPAPVATHPMEQVDATESSSPPQHPLAFD